MNTKKLLIIVCILANQFINTVNAQAPQSFNYQAVARDASGAVLSNQAVSFRISLLQGSATGSNVYSETHPITTNQFGLVNFAIGGGTIVSGSFANINWAQGPYFAQIELDATGGSTYVIMNTTQLLSVPYAQYAEKSGNPTLQAGSGIAIQNDSIINTAQNQQVNLSGTGQTNITGTYPNYVVNTPTIQAGNGISVTGQTITNTAPDQTVTINGTGQTNVTGTYPNFTVNTPPYTAGTGINISGTNISAQNTNAIWNANKLQNKNIDTLTPSLGNVLQYDGTNWKPSDKLPQMTTAQREALINVYTGMTILNTNTDCIEYYNGTKWLGLCGTEGEVGSSETGGLQQGGIFILDSTNPFEDTTDITSSFSINNSIFLIINSYNSNNTFLYEYNTISHTYNFKGICPFNYTDIIVSNFHFTISFSENQIGYLALFNTNGTSTDIILYKYNPISNNWTTVSNSNLNLNYTAFYTNQNFINFLGVKNSNAFFFVQTQFESHFLKLNLSTYIINDSTITNSVGTLGLRGHWMSSNNIYFSDYNHGLYKYSINDNSFSLINSSSDYWGGFLNGVNSNSNYSSLLNFGNKKLFLKQTSTNITNFHELFEINLEGHTIKNLNIQVDPSIMRNPTRNHVINNVIYSTFANKIYKLIL
jgi:hypothetical protein